MGMMAGNESGGGGNGVPGPIDDNRQIPPPPPPPPRWAPSECAHYYHGAVLKQSEGHSPLADSHFKRALAKVRSLKRQSLRAAPENPPRP